MAMDRTPAFVPPMDTVPESGKDPLIVKIEENSMEWAARKTSQNEVSWQQDQPIRHISNGR